MPTHTFPDSSNIASISYEGTTLTVEFRSTGKYAYYDVPESKYKEAVEAKSIGQWVWANLKSGQYNWKKV